MIIGRYNPCWYDAIAKWLETLWIETVERKVCSPKYDGDYLHKKIKDMVGQKRLHETLTNVIIPSFDIKLLQPALKVYISVQITCSLSN